MAFGIGRSGLLKVLAYAMDVDSAGASAFLGRFQHLQRLRLVEGINPGRGKQAEYRAHHAVVIAIAMQLLQLGMTPERAVRIIKDNQDRVRLGISLAVPSSEEFASAFFHFDPALLSELGATSDECDHAEQTFDYSGPGKMLEWIEDMMIRQDVPRLAIINVRGTILGLTSGLIDMEFPNDSLAENEAPVHKLATAFHHDLYHWVCQSNPDSLE